ncbi:MAG: glutaredoxin family protein [Amphritea sp.]
MSTSGCHLCDEAVEVVVATMDPLKHQVEEVDIAFEDGLMERYALLIPVLLDEQSGNELRWPFDQQQLLAFFAGL